MKLNNSPFLLDLPDTSEVFGLISILDFFHGKKVLVTGHTGFKGSWLCRMLLNAGAALIGYSLEPPTNPNLFSISGIEENMHSIIGDIRDKERLGQVFRQIRPEIVFHLAAQPIVREGYIDPSGTYDTNIMGTVNILECIRRYEGVRSFVNITTDKVYRNNEWPWGYRENDILDGHDPYSNSKSCSELVTWCYQQSFFQYGETAISTARAGNVIGGGDFAVDRIIPDCIRAAQKGAPIVVRNPSSIRPWQHVLEPLFAYARIAQAQYDSPSLAGAYNVGPDDADCVTTGELTTLFCRSWGEGLRWEVSSDSAFAPREAHFLKLDSSKIRSLLHWCPIWNIETSIQKTVEWTKTYLTQGDVRTIMDEQIRSFVASRQEAPYAR